jgi:hypothetical protein
LALGWKAGQMTTADLRQPFVAQLNVVLREYEDLQSRGFPQIDGPDELTGFVTRARPSIELLARPSSGSS